MAGTQDLTDGELFYIIHNGIRLTGMPAFGQGSPEEDTDSWKLVHFIRHLPRITSDELEEMKAMNPKSRHQMDDEEAVRRFLAGEDIQPTEPEVSGCLGTYTGAAGSRVRTADYQSSDSPARRGGEHFRQVRP